MRTQNDPPGVSFPYRLFLSTTTGSSQIADTWRVPTPPSSAALGTKRAVSHNVAPDPATSKGDDQWTTGMNQKNGVFFANWPQGSRIPANSSVSLASSTAPWTNP